jgi:hypothetical protein
MAKIRRKQDFRDRNPSDPGIGEFVPDQLFQLFPDVFRDAFVAMRVQLSGYNSNVKLGLLLLLCGCAWAQPLSVYSEFANIDATGKVTAPESPREILSPALARNAFTSFQVVVQVPNGTKYQLYFAQNPENSVRVTLYRENGERLVPVDPPFEGDSTQVFWLDLWTDRNAPVDRIKVEPQLHLNGDWVIYPMEGRVMNAIVPDGKWPSGLAPPSEVMRSFACGTKAAPAAQGSDALIPGLRFRNAQQDVALAAKAPLAELQQRFGPCTDPAPTDPEWYFRIRDYLFRLP